MEHREYLKALTKKDSSIDISEMLVSEESKVLRALLDCQGRFNTTYLNEPLSDGIKWIMGYSNYINQTFLKERPKVSLTKDYSKGSIIYVDFFGHFGNELTYDHPAIVLAESGEDIIVAPISSTESLYTDNLDYHIKLPANVENLGSRPSNCTIKLEQLRFISKRRILVNFKNRVSDNDKLKEIDIALIKLLSEVTFNEYEETHKAYEELLPLIESLQNTLVASIQLAEELDQDNTLLDEENIQLFEENQKLNEEIKSLKETIHKMELEKQQL